jgi:glycosyltransferase involved in cell wall biosynthesis
MLDGPGGAGVAQRETLANAVSSTVPPAATKVRAAIGVLVARFPRIDETYILREINELERQGQPVVLIPLLRDYSKVVHEEAKPWLRRALYLPLFSGTILRANLARLFREPARYLGLLLRLIAGTISRPKTLLRTLALFPKSVYLADVLPARGIEHIHAHFATYATTMAYIVSSLSEVTFSFTVHGPDVFVHRLLMEEKLAGAKFVRTISTFNKAFLLGLYPEVTKDKIEVVHMGLNPDVYAQARSLAEGHSRLHILSAAALLPNKGYPYLIDACARLIADGVDLECTIVGDGPLRGAAEAWIHEHGLADRVRLLGIVPQHEVARLVGSCDIFVLPSIIANDGQMDGIPMSLMEAMAAGRPVIGASISGIPELVEHERSGILIDATLADRLAAAIRRLAFDPELRERMGAAGVETVSEAFNVRNTTRALVSLLDRHELAPPVAKEITALDWQQLGADAVGIRRTVIRRDAIVADVTISDGQVKREVIVKLHRPETPDGGSAQDCARNEFDILERLHQDMSAAGAEASSNVINAVPRPLLFDEPHAAIVSERAAGATLTSLIQEARTRGPRRLAVPLRRAGTWLRLMQEQTFSAHDGRHILTAIVLLAIRDLDLAAAADRKLRRHRQAIINALRLRESRVADKPLPVVGRHGDYSPANIFLSDRRLDVVNFEAFRDGLGLNDVARFLLHLELMPWRSRRVAEDVRQAFLSGYTNGQATVDAETLELCRIIQALQMLVRDEAATTHSRAAHDHLRDIVLRSVR